jgi:hypothetical protein
VSVLKADRHHAAETVKRHRFLFGLAGGHWFQCRALAYPVKFRPLGVLLWEVPLLAKTRPPRGF